jgi:hypothetical protein
MSCTRPQSQQAIRVMEPLLTSKPSPSMRWIYFKSVYLNIPEMDAPTYPPTMKPSKNSSMRSRSVMAVSFHISGNTVASLLLDREAKGSLPRSCRIAIVLRAARNSMDCHPCCRSAYHRCPLRLDRRPYHRH